jgi:hypothetical protein
MLRIFFLFSGHANRPGEMNVELLVGPKLKKSELKIEYWWISLCSVIFKSKEYLKYSIFILQSSIKLGGLTDESN